jgi:hypothetical protein
MPEDKPLCATLTPPLRPIATIRYRLMPLAIGSGMVRSDRAKAAKAPKTKNSTTGERSVSSKVLTRRLYSLPGLAAILSGRMSASDRFRYEPLARSSKGA